MYRGVFLGVLLGLFGGLWGPVGLGQEIRPPGDVVVGIPAVAAVEGLSLTDFAESGVVRVYPATGVQVFDSVSLLEKTARLLIFATRPGRYTIVVAAVAEGKLVYCECTFDAVAGGSAVIPPSRGSRPVVATPPEPEGGDA